MAFKLKTRGIVSMEWSDGDIVRALNRSAKGVRPIATRGMHRAGKTLSERMRENLRKHDKGGGRLENSIGYRLDNRRGLQTMEVGPGIEDDSVEGYMFVIEEGRSPGSAPPPRGALLPWLQRKGIPERAEYPIRMKIAREGMQGQPFPYIDPALDQEADVLDEIADEIMDDVSKMIVL